MKAFVALVAVLICMPVSMWLQYQILVRVNASELMFFLYWVNLPLLIFVQFATKLLEKD